MEKPLSIGICDSNESDAAQLRSIITSSTYDTQVCVCASGEALLDTFKFGLYDLLFIDVDLGNTSGMDVAVSLRKKDAAVPIVFTAAEKGRTLKKKIYQSLYCIEKPVGADIVAQCLDLAHAMSQNKRKRKLSFITDMDKKRDVYFEDILYIRADGSACLVYTEKSKEPVITGKVSLDTLGKQLPTPQFYRSHRNYLVNLQKVRGFVDHDMVLDNGWHVLVRIGDRTKLDRIFSHYVYTLTREQYGTEAQ